MERQVDVQVECFIYSHPAGLVSEARVARDG